MNKRIAILLLLVFISVSSIFAQAVENKTKIDTQNKTFVKIGEQLLSTEQIKSELPYDVNKKEAIRNGVFFPSEIAPINSSQELSPFFYAYPMIMKKNPILTDFYKFEQKQIYKQFSFVGSGEKVSYLGLGEYLSINGAIHWVVYKNLFIDVGGMFSRQFYLASALSRQDIMGMNTRMQYSLTNNIQLNIWGQYIFPKEQSPLPADHPLFPHTGVGASISVDLKKNTEMSIGAEYQFDNKSQEWKLESSGRVSIGF
nr:hypothetical protein [uncultured Bacteroides sp.]